MKVFGILHIQRKRSEIEGAEARRRVLISDSLKRCLLIMKEEETEEIDRTGLSGGFRLTASMALVHDVSDYCSKHGRHVLPRVASTRSC